MKKLERPNVTFETGSNSVRVITGKPVKKALLDYIEGLEERLAECYRLSGADTDGDEDWRLASIAVKEVKRLREDYDETLDDYSVMYDLIKLITREDLQADYIKQLAKETLNTLAYTNLMKNKIEKKQAVVQAAIELCEDICKPDNPDHILAVIYEKVEDYLK